MASLEGIGYFSPRIKISQDVRIRQDFGHLKDYEPVIAWQPRWTLSLDPAAPAVLCEPKIG